MDLRPQSHEIIRTWAFYTIVKAWLHEREIPWRSAAISGWVLDPDRKKMSKSKGNVVTPMHLLDQFGADAVRYWSLAARLGTDTAFDEKVFAVGRRLVMKLYNASKYALAQSAPEGPVSHPLDLGFLARLGETIARATTLLEDFDYAGALDVVERFFWSGYTDNYLELVKLRARSETDAAGRSSAVRAAQHGLSVLLRLFAPYLPYVTEEVWSWGFAGATGHRSIHRAPWPGADELGARPEARRGRARVRRRVRVPRRGAARQERRRRARWAASSKTLRLAASPETVELLGPAWPTCGPPLAPRATSSRRARASSRWPSRWWSWSWPRSRPAPRPDGPARGPGDGVASRGGPRLAAVEWHAAIGSTSDRLKELARAGAPEWTVVLAERQTGGRGREGRAWASPPGGLYLSVLLRPRAAPAACCRSPPAWRSPRRWRASASRPSSSGRTTCSVGPQARGHAGRGLVGQRGRRVGGAGDRRERGARPGEPARRAARRRDVARRGGQRAKRGPDRVAAAVLARLAVWYDALREAPARVAAAWRERAVPWWGRLVEVRAARACCAAGSPTSTTRARSCSSSRAASCGASSRARSRGCARPGPERHGLLLTIDAGNTNTILGVYEGLRAPGTLAAHHAARADRGRVRDPGAQPLRGLGHRTVLHRGGGHRERGAAPHPRPGGAVARLPAGAIPWWWGPGVKTGMPILYEPPGDVGADRIVNGVAAFAAYGGPVVVVDFGTATTFDVVTKKGEYVGGVICPGIGISADALFQRAARLPRVDIAKPGRVIGRSTVGSMQSGLYYGYAEMVQGIIGRIRAELGEPVRVVATGGSRSRSPPTSRPSRPWTLRSP